MRTRGECMEHGHGTHGCIARAPGGRASEHARRCETLHTLQQAHRAVTQRYAALDAEAEHSRASGSGMRTYALQTRATASYSNGYAGAGFHAQADIARLEFELEA